MQNKEAIAALQQQIEGLRQDLALGHISKSEFGTERGKLLAQIDVLDTRPNCLYSPDPKPGHFADPSLQLRIKMLKDYNRQISELRVNGIKDHVGHRVYGSENMVRTILTRALAKTDKARSLEVLQYIASDTEAQLQAAMPFSKAA